MKNITITIILSVFCGIVFAQHKTFINDTVITLQEVSVYSKNGLELLQSNNKKGEIHISVKGKSSFVTKVEVNKDKSYKIESLEFFFNYQWQGFKEEGFYIKPLILMSENEKPGSVVFNAHKKYFVSREIDEIIHIDLTNFNIEISDVNSFFIGLEFTGKGKNNKFEDFNVTMVPLRKSLNSSFIKGSCSDCKYTPLDLDEKRGLSLKYNIYYKE